MESLSVALRIFGDELDPEQISGLLGQAPTRSSVKGEETIGRVTGERRVQRTGMWILSEEKDNPAREDLDSVVLSVLTQTSSDVELWNQIRERYSVDILCGLFLSSADDHFGLSNLTLAELKKRGLTINFDVYCAKLQA